MKNRRPYAPRASFTAVNRDDKGCLSRSDKRDIDKIDDGWRQVPRWGVLPDEPPRQPIASQETWKAYRKSACSYESYLINRLTTHRERHPKQRARLLAKLLRRTAASAKRRA